MSSRRKNNGKYSREGSEREIQLAIGEQDREVKRRAGKCRSGR